MRRFFARKDQDATAGNFRDRPQVGGQFMVAAQANPVGALFLLGLVTLVLYMPVALAAMTRTARSRRR